MQDLFGFDAGRLRKDELLREAEQERLVRRAQGEEKRDVFAPLSRVLSAMISSVTRVGLEDAAISGSDDAKVHTLSISNRRCKNKAA